MNNRPDKSLIRAVVLTIVKLSTLFIVVAFILSRIPDEDRKLQSYGVTAALVFLSVLYGIYFYYQLKGIRTAQYPGLRATEAMVSTAFLFLAMFATIYTIISEDDPTAFTEELSPFTSLYFAITVLSTVGFGDITPVTVPARAITMIQMALGLVYIGVVVRVFSSAAKNRKSQKTREGGTEHSDPRG